MPPNTADTTISLEHNAERHLEVDLQVQGSGLDLIVALTTPNFPQAQCPRGVRTSCLNWIYPISTTFKYSSYLWLRNKGEHFADGNPIVWQRLGKGNPSDGMARSV